jgi:hypothetical protein
MFSDGFKELRRELTSAQIGGAFGRARKKESLDSGCVFREAFDGLAYKVWLGRGGNSQRSRKVDDLKIPNLPRYGQLRTLDYERVHFFLDGSWPVTRCDQQAKRKARLSFAVEVLHRMGQLYYRCNLKEEQTIAALKSLML